jgi:transcriptional regulator with XRE-family HTH domain
MAESRFASRLRELREVAGLTQPQLAERAGLSKGGIADLEQGRREPAWSTVLALAGALEVSCEAFTQEPGDVEPRGKGRPPRPEAPPGKRPAGTKKPPRAPRKG